MTLKCGDIKVKNTSIISDIFEYYYNSGLGYDLSNFIDYFTTQNEQFNKSRIDKIKYSEWM